jgi:hypothetical protein
MHASAAALAVAIFTYLGIGSYFDLDLNGIGYDLFRCTLPYHLATCYSFANNAHMCRWFTGVR